MSEWPDIFVWQRKRLKLDQPIKLAFYPPLEDRLVLGKRKHRYLYRGDDLKRGTSFWVLPSTKREFIWRQFVTFYYMRKRKKKRFTKWHVNKACRSIGVVVE